MDVADVDGVATLVNVPHAFPVQLFPVTVHVTPALPTSFVTVAVKFNVCDTGIPPRFGVRLTLTLPDTTAVMVIVAAADFETSATEVAVSVTVAGVGTLAGAVYVTATPDKLEVGITVPHVAPQPAPDTAQVTPLFPVSFCKVAVNACVPPVWTLVVVSDNVTAIGAGAAVTVIVAATDFVPSATEVAVSVTAAGVGTLAGAVYVTATPDALEVGVTAPHVAPLQPAPDTVQVTPLFAASFCTVAVNACDPLTCTIAVVSDSVTAIGAGAAVTVIVAATDFVPSATEVAVSVTAAGVGTLAGAVYVTATPDALEVGVTAPHVAPLQPVPLKAQVTPLFAVSFCTVAVNACDPLTCTDAVVSDSATAIAGGVAVTVIIAAADFVLSATDVAVIVTVAGAGTLGGAVYVTAVPEALVMLESAPHVPPLQPAPESAHVTPLLELSLVTVAVKACGCPACTDELVGETLTEIAARSGGAAPADPRLLEAVPAQPEIHSRVIVLTIDTLKSVRSAKARLKAQILPKFDYWIWSRNCSRGVGAALIHV